MSLGEHCENRIWCF